MRRKLSNLGESDIRKPLSEILTGDFRSPFWPSIAGRGQFGMSVQSRQREIVKRSATVVQQKGDEDISKNEVNDIQEHSASSPLNSTSSIESDCEEGWTMLEERCFIVVQKEMPWKKAEQNCINLGGHLASVTSATLSEKFDKLTKEGNAISDPSNTFWIGATDSDFENAFTWTSGAPFLYADWFPGWEDQNGYSSQPSDDGLGNEDCVELRRSFRLATKGIRVTSRLFWNDRDCKVLNRFICEKFTSGDHFPQDKKWSCNKTLNIAAGAPSTLVTSPGYPLSYPSRLNCVTTLKTTPGATITILFDAFILEDHPQCAFDLLEIYEPGSSKKKVLCGDWTRKLKLLRYQSQTREVILTLRSDPAHTFAGFKLRVTAAMGEGGCGTQWQIRHGSTCLLAANNPQVTWATASRICKEADGELASLNDVVTLSWLTEWLYNHPRFMPEARFWIGGQLRGGSWVWEDGKPVQRKVSQNIYGNFVPEPSVQLCLSVEESSTLPHSTRHYGQPGKHRLNLASVSHFCDGFGGYICSKRVKESPSVINRTILGREGNVTTPAYPNKYPNDVHMTVTLEGPPSSRLVLVLRKMSLEFQEECLYDFLGLQNDGENEKMVRFCGHHPQKTKKPVFVSKSNRVILTFHSDWSESGAGAVVDWRAVDTKGCPFQEKNESKSVLMSPNFPYFNLPGLQCTTIIKAPKGHRVWLQFQTFEISHTTEDISEKDASKPVESWRKINFSSGYSAFARELIRPNPPHPSSHSNDITPFLASSPPPPSSSTSLFFDNFSSSIPPHLSNTTASFAEEEEESTKYDFSATLLPLPVSALQSRKRTRRFHSKRSVSVSLSSSHSSSASFSSKLSHHFEASARGESCKMDFIEVHLSDNEKLRLCGIISKDEVENLAFISQGNTLKLFLHTSELTRGRGFKASYKTGLSFNEEAIIKIRSPFSDSASGMERVTAEQKEILPLNFPHLPSTGVTFTRHLFAPLGNRLTINLHNVANVARQGKSCPQSYLEIEDWYASKTGTIWRICSFDLNSTKKISLMSTFNSIFIREVYTTSPESKPFRLSEEMKQDVAVLKEFRPNDSEVSMKLEKMKYQNINVLPQTEILDEDKEITAIDTDDVISPKVLASTTFDSVEEKKFDYLQESNTLSKASKRKTQFIGSDENKVQAIFNSHSSSEISLNDLEEANNTNLFDSEFIDSSSPTTSSRKEHQIFETVSTSFPEEFLMTPQTTIYSDIDQDYVDLPEAENNADEVGIQSQTRLLFKISYSIIPDPDWINRSLGLNVDMGEVRRLGVASCHPSPCIHEERCVTHGSQHMCLCIPAYTGLFCQVHWCDIDPCVMGRCHSSSPQSGFTCTCEPGWGGDLCNVKISPCAKKPCQGRGECSVVNNTFSCRCHAWWEGSHCQNRIRTIPYKPLSERMFQEPFWLGLITVAVVMCCIGVVFCIKKHFADKIEKFFAEEIERSKYGGVSGSRPNPLPSPTGLSPRPRPKSLLVRLNSFRKSSLLSLSSTASSPQGEGPPYTFDDLLKPHKRGSGGGGGGASSPRRQLSKSRSQTVSPRIDSKKILRHLIAPPVANRAPSFDEFLNLRTQNSKCSVISDEFRRLRSASPEVPPSHFNHPETSNHSSNLEGERTLSADISELCVTGPPPDRRASGGDSHDLVQETSLISLAPSPTKQDKKVSFAKLMEKIQKEMSSSSSDISMVEDKSPSRGMSLGSLVGNGAIRRSPRRSPRLKRSTRSSGSGSEDVIETPEISSSEMIPDPPKRLLSLKSSSSPSSKTSSPQNRSKLTKISSADSLLAMFRSIGGTSRSSISSPTSPHGSEVEDSSAQGSPSTTPTTPPKSTVNTPKDTLLVPGALQVQVHGQAGSTKASPPTVTLEVPTEQYRCLSPITELPTPMPTPMHSPLPTPSRYHTRQINTNSESSPQENTMEDTESEFSINISAERSSSDSSGSEPRTFFGCSKYSSSHLANRRKSKDIPKISLSTSVTSSPTPPISSPKTKSKPPPLTISNSNLLNFKAAEEEEKEQFLPMIRIQDEEGEVLAPFDSTPRTRSQSVDIGSVMKTPLITVCCVDESPPSTSSSSTKSDPSTSSVVIPTLSVTIASPPAIHKHISFIPTIKEDNYNSDLGYKKQEANFVKTPKITVTTTMSEIDSDLDTPLEKSAPTTTTARYLSPLFAANIQATSDGNLSSSGYSSAYSSGPSRCSSNNRLSAGENEEPLTPSVSSIPSKPAVLYENTSPRNKRSPLIKSSTEPLIIQPSMLVKTDSETTDEPDIDTGECLQPEPDSALEIDTNDECQDNTDGCDESESQENMRTDLNNELLAQKRRLLLTSSNAFPKEPQCITKANPTVISTSPQSDSSVEESTSTIEKKSLLVSPTSSRSESPISDSRLSVQRIYPAFFSSKSRLDLPYTDSDGLYDCPSLEVLHSDSSRQIPVRRQSKRKTKKPPKFKNFTSNGHSSKGNGEGSKRVLSLELPTWEPRSSRKLSQKRRARTHTSVDLLSSSSESFTSHSGTTGECLSPMEILSDIGCHDSKESEERSGGLSRARRKQLMRGESISCRNLRRQRSVEGSEEENDQKSLQSSKVAEDLPRFKKSYRLRGFGNQLRFLRHLQLTRTPQDQLMSASDSSESDLDSNSPTNQDTDDPPFLNSPNRSQKIPNLKQNLSGGDEKYKTGPRKVRSS